MADRESRVLLSVVDKYSHGLAGFAGGMENAYSKVKGLQQGLQTLAGGGGGVAGAVIKTVIDATKYTIQWAGEIDLLSRVTGTGARETSKLAIVFGDVGIGLDVLRASARKMASEGLELNFKSIVALAKEYQALPPGVERSRFAMEKFGRAGGEMSEILDRDISEIEALGRAAEKSGKIVGDDFVKNAEKLETGMHQLQDRMEGFKILVGGPVIDTVNKAAQAETDWIGILQLVAVKAGQVTGIMSDQAASVKAAQIAGLSYEEAINQVYAAEVKMVDASDRLHESNTSLTSSYAPLGAGAMDAAYWIKQGADAEKDASDKAYNLAAAQRELAAGLAGPLGQAQEEHASTTQDLGKQISETEKEIAKLRRSQGVYVEVVKDATVSQAEYQLAVFNATEAQTKLNEAAGDTAPEKLLALQIAAEKAAEKAAKLGGELGSTSGYTVDNSNKVSELTGHLADLQAQQEAANAAMEFTTNQMLFQAAAAGGLSDPALTALAHSMGLIDAASYHAQKQMDILTKQYQDGKISADEYAKGTKAAADAINALQSRHIQVTIDTIYYEERRQSGAYVPHEQGQGGMGGYQFGGLVPAMKTIMVGERGPELLRLDRPGRVQSDTAGGGGGNNNALTTEFITALRALPLQIKLAMRGA